MKGPRARKRSGSRTYNATPKAKAKAKATARAAQPKTYSNSNDNYRYQQQAAPTQPAVVTTPVAVKKKIVLPTVEELQATTKAEVQSVIESQATTKQLQAKYPSKINPFGGAAMASIMSIADPSTRSKSLLTGYQNTTTSRDNFDKSIYDKEAAVGRDSLIRGDKYRNDEVSYNQAYWASRLESGKAAGNKNIQAEMAAEQKALGSKKTYSGDRAITQQDQQKSKYILDVLGKSGIKPTVTSETSGLFDEMTTTKSSYDIGTGKPMTTTNQTYSPVIKGFRLGDDVTKTFVNGVATYTKKGEGKRTTSELGSLKQRSQSSPDAVKEMADIDNQIKTETDPAKLKALHKRRLMLMRMNRTNTRFAGLLGEADTKRTNLMSIS
tara:strand:+ start:159 stop:1301 length:1143 start_codon:yes stop_codon:yes gene_type:complete